MPGRGSLPINAMEMQSSKTRGGLEWLELCILSSHIARVAELGFETTCLKPGCHEAMLPDGNWVWSSCSCKSRSISVVKTEGIHLVLWAKVLPEVTSKCSSSLAHMPSPQGESLGH